MHRLLRLFVSIAVLASGLYIGTGPGQMVADNSITGEVTLPNDSTAHPKDTIRIATWNIENLGKTKAKDPSRMGEIASVLKDYDIIAVQEVSNLHETSDPGCLRNNDSCPGHGNCNMINDALEMHLNQAYGKDYGFLMSPQIKDERYLYIYDRDKVDLTYEGVVEDSFDSDSLCAYDPKDTGLMVRQPYRADFRSGDLDFTLLTAHTSPSSNLDELEGLEYLLRQEMSSADKDMILLGDLNADCRYLGDDDDIALRDDRYIWVVDDGSDTTVSGTDCAYDRIIFQESTSEDFTGEWGIERGISEDVSDHYLVWAEFYTGNDSD